MPMAGGSQSGLRAGGGGAALAAVWGGDPPGSGGSSLAGEAADVAFVDSGHRSNCAYWTGADDLQRLALRRSAGLWPPLPIASNAISRGSERIRSALSLA